MKQGNQKKKWNDNEIRFMKSWHTDLNGKDFALVFKRSLISVQSKLYALDGNKLNNDITNLCMMSKSEHSFLHYTKRGIDSRGRFK